MPHTGSSCATSHDIDKTSVGVNGRIEDGCVDEVATSETNDSSGVRERVIKEVGLTSTAFIGPAFPPPKHLAVKSDIEDTLSEFYKELDKIDTPDGANDIPGKHDTGCVQTPIPPKTKTSKETLDVSEDKILYTNQSAEIDGYQKSSGKKQTSWSHWYQNEPYYPRRPRPAAPTQSQQHYPQTLNRPPIPGFHRPPFHRPPPPPAFPNPQNTPTHIYQSWSTTGTMNQYQEESNFPIFPGVPPPNVHSHPSQGFYEASRHHFDRDEQSCNYDIHSDDLNAGWSRNRKEELYPVGEDYGRLHRFDLEIAPWEQHPRPPDDAHVRHSPLVLILMRGLPGSGKSTLARKLLTTGPSGLILSTDDYFSHRDGYHYEPGFLGAAHEWNQCRAKDAMHDGRSPIIIDNTNAQAWEMKPYVKMALENGYKVDFCEPETSWKFDPYELERRNKHGVPKEKIAQMMDRFSFPVSVDIVMSSQEPAHVNQRRRPEQLHMIR